MYRISLLLAFSGLYVWGCSQSAAPPAEEAGTSPTTVTANKPAPDEDPRAEENSRRSESAEDDPQRAETPLPEGEDSAQRARRELEEAGDAVADWATDTKQQLIDMAEERLSELDKQLADLKQQAQDLDDAAKVRFQEETRMIEQKRREYSQQLDALKNSSDEAWKKLAQGIAKAFRELKQATKDAVGEFE